MRPSVLLRIEKSQPLRLAIIFCTNFLFITTYHRQLLTNREPILPVILWTSLLARTHESVHQHLLHDSPHKQQGHGHSPKVSQTQKTSTKITVVHAQAPFVCHHPCAHTLTFLTARSCLFPTKSLLDPSISSASQPLCRSARSHDAAVHTRRKHTEMETIADCAVVSVRYLVECKCACVPLLQ